MHELSEDFELNAETWFIHGLWIDLGSRMEKDSSWLRIEWLLENRLELVASSAAGQLYRNPVDGQFWHHFPLAPELTSASPPALERISLQQARELFGDIQD